MVHPCDKPCGNKTVSGYCATTACINPQYSNIGTAHYGQGVQKRIVTNADRIRAMSDEELAEFCFRITDDVASYYGGDGYEPKYPVASKGWLDWLEEEAKDGNN